MIWPLAPEGQFEIAQLGLEPQINITTHSKNECIVPLYIYHVYYFILSDIDINKCEYFDPALFFLFNNLAISGTQLFIVMPH